MSTGSDKDLHEPISDTIALAECITSAAEHFREWLLQLIDSSESTDVTMVNLSVPERVYHGGRGRPPYHIPQSQIEALIELRFTYERMAKQLNISTRTLLRRRMHYGLPSGVVTPMF